MPKRVVLHDAVSWMTETGLLFRPFHHNTAYRGDEVDLPDTEVERLEALGAVGTQADLAARDVADGAPSPEADEALRAKNVDDTNAYVSQRPYEAEHVLDLENDREKPRKGVLDHVERVIEERDRVAAEQAEGGDETGVAIAQAAGAPTIPA